MNGKKIYLSCVYKKNFGDDLLVKKICDRYSETKFTAMTFRYKGKIQSLRNLEVKKYNNFFYRAVRKLCNILGINMILDYMVIRKCDLLVSVAGSIFMEKRNQSCLNELEWYSMFGKKYYILGSNIGPVFTNQYVQDVCREVFDGAEDVCLRDEKSYEMAKQFTDNVRVAPDIVFGLPVEKYMNNTVDKKVIFSLISIKEKAGQIVNPEDEKYKDLMCKMIIFFMESGYEVELFSFCKQEGDENIINEIMSMDKRFSKLGTYFYDGNIEEGLKEFSTAEIVVGTRFHAKILALLMQKTLIPVIYNDKSRNLLDDINFEGVSIDIDKIDEFKIEELSEKNLGYKVFVDKEISEAEKHFIELDKELGRR